MATTALAIPSPAPDPTEPEIIPPTIRPTRKSKEVGRHAHTHEAPKLSHGKYDELDGLDGIDKVISVGAGYERTDYYNDMVAAFRDDHQTTRLDLRGQVREWMAEALQYDGPGKMTMARAEYRAAQFYKFMHRFTRSESRQNFLDMANGDPELAARAMMEYTAKAGDQNQANNDGNDSQGDADGCGGLGQLLGMEEYGGESAGPAFGFGEGAGSGSPETIARAMRISELLPKLRRKYSFAAGRKFDREVSPYPADDMDYRPMRTYADITRVPVSALAMDDDLFFDALAKKALPVMEHFVLNPMVRHFGLAIDVSGSMTGALADGYFRYEYATATAIALLEQAEAGCNKVSAVLFDDATHPPITGTPREVAGVIWKAEFSGGGTAFQPVFDFFDKYDDMELGVMITDGGASFQKKPNTQLQVLICGKDGGTGNLKAIATKLEVVA
jgi:hypothetical protein